MSNETETDANIDQEMIPLTADSIEEMSAGDFDDEPEQRRVIRRGVFGAGLKRKQQPSADAGAAEGSETKGEKPSQDNSEAKPETAAVASETVAEGEDRVSKEPEEKPVEDTSEEVTPEDALKEGENADSALPAPSNSPAQEVQTSEIEAPVELPPLETLPSLHGLGGLSDLLKERASDPIKVEQTSDDAQSAAEDDVMEVAPEDELASVAVNIVLQDEEFAKRRGHGSAASGGSSRRAIGRRARSAARSGVADRVRKILATGKTYMLGRASQRKSIPSASVAKKVGVYALAGLMILNLDYDRIASRAGSIASFPLTAGEKIASAVANMDEWTIGTVDAIQDGLNEMAVASLSFGAETLSGMASSLSDGASARGAGVDVAIEAISGRVRDGDTVNALIDPSVAPNDKLDQTSSGPVNN